jgi:hypothetical protein
MRTSKLEGLLSTAELAREFTLGGNAYLTLRSKRTQTRYTFNCRKQKNTEPSAYSVSLLVGPDRYYLIGWLRGAEHHPTFQPLERTRYNEKYWPQIGAFGWYWHHLLDNQLMSELEVWHDGACGVCGRQLTVPESVARGIGPECANKLRALDLLEELGI